MLYGACYSIYSVLLASHECMCASVHRFVCVLFCYSLRKREHSNLPISLESADAFSMRETPVSSLYLWGAHLISCCSWLHFLFHYLTNTPFSVLLPSGFYSSNSSWTIKLLTSKVTHPDTKRSWTFCHKTCWIKLENPYRRRTKSWAFVFTHMMQVHSLRKVRNEEMQHEKR